MSTTSKQQAILRVQLTKQSIDAALEKRGLTASLLVEYLEVTDDRIEPEFDDHVEPELEVPDDRVEPKLDDLVEPELEVLDDHVQPELTNNDLKCEFPFKIISKLVQVWHFKHTITLALQTYYCTTNTLKTYQCAVRSCCAIDGISCIAIFLGKLVKFEFVLRVKTDTNLTNSPPFLKKAGVLNSIKLQFKFQFWQIVQLL